MSIIGDAGSWLRDLGADTMDRLPDRNWVRWPVLFVVLVMIAWYPVGMVLVHNIDDNTDFAEPAGNADGAASTDRSRTVDTMAALVDREINRNRWTPNDPFFMPSWPLDNMPNFQLGILDATSRLGVELADNLGRLRGSSGIDEDLKEAAGLLKFTGTKWIWDPSVSIWPSTPSEQQYEQARKRLLKYNDRLTQGQAVFERRADNLQVTLERIASDLGGDSQALDNHVRDFSGSWFDGLSDDQFYRVKGKTYAYYLLLRDLGHDFEPIISNRQLTSAWQELLVVMRELASLDPLIIRNGEPDAVLSPNHLAAQGFYLLRARTKLKEISNILLK